MITFAQSKLPYQYDFKVPQDVCNELSKYITIRELGICCRVSKEWNKWASHDAIWSGIKEKKCFRRLKILKNKTNLKSEIDKVFVSIGDLTKRVENFINQTPLNKESNFCSYILHDGFLNYDYFLYARINCFDIKKVDEIENIRKLKLEANHPFIKENFQFENAIQCNLLFSDFAIRYSGTETFKLFNNSEGIQGEWAFVLYDVSGEERKYKTLMFDTMDILVRRSFELLHLFAEQKNKQISQYQFNSNAQIDSPFPSVAKNMNTLSQR